MPQGFCTEVTPECPVSETTDGYRPNLAGNIILLVVFGICTIAQLVLGFRYRLRAFTFAVSLGCLGETIGYGGRLMMHANPWSSTGFKVQICCLILSPSFLAAGIYLTLKHQVIYFGSAMSRLKPRFYTWIFISCDVLSILAQAAGGGVASAETTALVDVGDDLMIAGIAFQVATMFVCLCLAADFGYQVFKQHGHRKPTADEMLETKELPSSFSLPEMAGGWGGPLMQNQVEFMILDGTMVAIAAILLTVAHPGIFFPAMTVSSRNPKAIAKDQDRPLSEDLQEKAAI
ncbi:hypothetical protein LTR08_002055 [Meristemomyces frigidus]|nr:hypothetical protein LTR08_002055 [Meristemomyces frigidus]